MRHFFGRFLPLLLVGALIFGCGCSLLPVEEELLPPKVVSATAVEYSTVTAEKTDLELAVNGGGSFRSFSSTTLSFEADGTLLSVNVAVNKRVKKGEVLATLDSSADIYMELANKKKELNNLEIEMAEAETEANGGGEVALKKLEWEQAEYYLEILQGGGSLSDGTTLDAQKIKTDIARVTYENALTKAQNTYEVYQSNYTIAQAEVELVQQQYDACFLKAPVSGVCTWTFGGRAGSTVKAGDEFITLVDPASITFAFSSSENITQYVELGTELTVTIDDVEYTGKVTQTPATQPAGTTYGTKYMYFIDVQGLDMENAELLGTTGAVKLVIDSRKDVIVIDKYLIPEADDEGKYYVSVLDNGLPISREVTLGLSNGTQVEITSGIEVGDLIIVG